MLTTSTPPYLVRQRCRGESLCGLEHLWGTGAPSSPARERRAHAERIEARERAGDFYPASELSGEIKLLLLLCVSILFLLESVSVL